MDETTLFLGKMAAAYLAVTGLGLLLSTPFYAKMVRASADTDPVALNLSGAVHFLAGMFVLVRHFRWSSLPEATITLVGIAAAAKGAGMIVVPESMLKSPKTGPAMLKLSGCAFLVVGGCLGYACFL